MCSKRHFCNMFHFYWKTIWKLQKWIDSKWFKTDLHHRVGIQRDFAKMSWHIYWRTTVKCSDWLESFIIKLHHYVTTCFSVATSQYVKPSWHLITCVMRDKRWIRQISPRQSRNKDDWISAEKCYSNRILTAGGQQSHKRPTRLGERHL